MSVPESLLEIMACPECRGGLAERGDALVCGRCGLHFPVRDGIPFMRPEDAFRPDESGRNEDAYRPEDGDAP